MYLIKLLEACQHLSFIFAFSFEKRKARDEIRTRDPPNYFITYPAYVEFYHMPLEAILGMYQAILPSANSLIKCLVIFNMPFTLVKGLLDAVLCVLIYKPLSPILHGRK